MSYFFFFLTLSLLLYYIHIKHLNIINIWHLYKSLYTTFNPTTFYHKYQGI